MKKKILMIVISLMLAVGSLALTVACIGGGGGGGTPTKLDAPTNLVFNQAETELSWTAVTPPSGLLGGIRYRVYADGVFLETASLTSLSISTRTFTSEDPDIVFTVVTVPFIPSANFQNSDPSQPVTLTRVALAAPTNVRTLAGSLFWTNPSATTSIHPARIYADGGFVLETAAGSISIDGLGLSAGDHEITVSLVARGRHLASPQSIPFTLSLRNNNIFLTV